MYNRAQSDSMFGVCTCRLRWVDVGNYSFGQSSGRLPSCPCKPARTPLPSQLPSVIDTGYICLARAVPVRFSLELGYTVRS